MIFGAMAAWQAWVLVAGAAALAGALFFVKLRSPRMPVSSLLFWRRVLDESRQQTLWERIRRAVSFAVTIFIALTLALAAAQPLPRGSGGKSATSGRLLIVVDSSWSMLARTRTGETRWERAVAQARRLASAASGAEVALATTADGLVQGPTTESAVIDAALDRIAPAGGDPASWPRMAGTSSVHFITDGSIARPRETGVVVHSVFESAANAAITAFDVRPSLGGDLAGIAYLEVTNYALSEQQVRIALTRGTTALIDRQVTMAPGEALRQVLPMVRGAEPVLRARVEARENALEIDDDAFAWMERARPLAVAIVGEETTWLRSLLERDPNVRTTVIAPDDYPRGSERAEVVIFDRWAPRDVPERPALYFAPAEGRSATTEEQRPQWEQTDSHPVVRGVDPFTLTIGRARGYSLPDLVPVARSARGTPLVYVHDSRDRRFVLVTFSAAESNLPSAPGFPVLIGNSLDWLTHAASEAIQGPGLVSFSDTVSTVTGPRGVPVPLTRLNGAAFGLLRSPGLYVIQGGGARSTIAVNVGDPQISNLLRTNLSGATRDSLVVPGASRTPWWIYCALTAFALAVVEWWTWQRRITV